MSTNTLEEIRAALRKMHHRAMGDTSAVYMSIPADPKRDADLILSAAVDELEQFRASAPADRAVMMHLVRLIQDSPDVRYYVGGFGSQMRELLCAAIKATGSVDDPVDVLKPAPHRSDEEPRVKRLERELDELRAAVSAFLRDQKSRQELESLL